jgi:UDP-GlcNAc:undecaprenyl-phosphate GlcNAc-1-phosphate transferase
MYLFIPWIISVCFTFAFTPVVIHIAKRYKLIDDPHIRYHPAHTHTGAIPRAGGLALYIGFFLCCLIFVPPNTEIIGILLASTILIVIGLLDDRRDVNPYFRLVANGITTMIVVFSGVQIPYITNPFSGGIIDFHRIAYPVSFPGFSFEIYPISIFFAAIWIFWTMNIIGWSAGIDGQMPGFVSISAFILGILSLRYSLSDQSQLWVTIIAFIVSGVFAGFLPWNFYPQKIMPGYGGKTLAGLFLAILGILSYAKLGTALLVLGIPSIDALYTLFRRWKKGTPLVSADRDHLHHRLLDIGWGKRRIALFYWMVSAILGVIALSITSKQKVFALLVMGVIISGIILWLNYFSQFSKQRDQNNG